MNKDLNVFRNIVLITIDSLRADHLGCYGYKQKTSPNIDKLAKNGVLFSKCISNSPTTLTSFRTILTSTYPTMYNDRYLSKKRTTIAEVLQKKGLHTAGFHSNPFLSKYYGYDRGFDVFYDSVFFNQLISEDKLKGKVESILNWMRYAFFTLTCHAFGTPHESIDKINRKVLYWLDENQRDFFLWVHYMDVHYPYISPKKYLKQFTSIKKSKALKLNIKLVKNPDDLKESEIEQLISLYDAGIKYVDEGIKKIVEKLEEKGIIDDTLLIITADHGDEFFDHGGFGHSMTTAYGDKFFKPLFGGGGDTVSAFGTRFGYPPNLYDELLHVPLIFYSPNILKSLVIDTQVQLLDIPPTLADAAKMDKITDFLGQSVLPLINNEKSYENKGVISENVGVKSAIKRSYRTEKWKLIVNEDKKCELYNLQKDPKEQKNIASDNPKKLEELIINMLNEKKQAEKAIIKKTLSKINLKTKN